MNWSRFIQHVHTTVWNPMAAIKLLRATVTLHCIIFPDWAAANWPLVDDVEGRVIVILLECGLGGVTVWDTCHPIPDLIPGPYTTSSVWTELPP